MTLDEDPSIPGSHPTDIPDGPKEDLVDLPSGGLELTHRPSTAGELASEQNANYLALIAGGMAPEAARLAVGAPRNIARRAEVQVAIRENLEWYVPNADVRRANLLGKLYRTLNTGNNSESNGAAAIIAKDPEVGMGAGAPVVQVNILSKDTQAVLETVEVPEGWETK